jgi:glycosyltransferase involved in cell wall biosynthesis
MNILFIAPLPPPISGHSIAAKVLYDYLAVEHNVVAIDLSISSSNDGTFTFRRSIEVVKALLAIWKHIHFADAIYLTISESFAGNLKDIIIYLIGLNRLNRFYIHLHGGSIKRLLFDVHPILREMNSFAIRRMAGVIICGRSHVDVFAKMIDNRRIHIIPNFSEDYLFVDDAVIGKKFSNLGILRMVYISGMTVGKGYLNLLDAYKNLSAEVQDTVHIDFAGRFDTAEECAHFAREIENFPGIAYHGVVDGSMKKSLFAQAHIFCLPTMMLEGQPISILEAYASGCVVITTGQAGIRDIFTDGINGYEVQPDDQQSIKLMIEKVRTSSADLVSIAYHNRQTALTNYRTDVFTRCVENVLVSSQSAKAIECRDGAKSAK